MEHLKDRSDAEIREEKVLSPRRPIVSKHNGNVSGARTAPGRVIWEKGQKATHVLVKGEKFDWIAKAPYVQSGYSILGAIEYCDATSEMKCHECGEWRRSLSQHIAMAHRNVNEHRKLTARDYKIRHGFRISKGLSSPENREQHRATVSNLGKDRAGLNSHNASARGNESRRHIVRVRREMGMGLVNSPESANLMNKCMAQREQLIMELYKRLGRTPTKEELRTFSLPDGSHPLNPERLWAIFNTPISKIFIRLGIPVRGRGASAFTWTPERRARQSLITTQMNLSRKSTQ